MVVKEGQRKKRGGRGRELTTKKIKKENTKQEKGQCIFPLAIFYSLKTHIL